MGDMLAGRVAVVTGAGCGLESGIARELAAEGAEVVAAGDAARWAEAQRAIDAVVERFGRLDVLVACAAAPEPPEATIADLAPARWSAVLAAHVKPVFHALRHACAHMRAQRHGRIVTVVPGAGFSGVAEPADVAAVAAAIGGLAKVAARDLGRYGITVNAVAAPLAPGEAERGPSSAVAPLVAYLASEQAADVNGQTFLCSRGLIALVSQPRPERTLFKPGGYWTLDDLDRLAPDALFADLADPAPAGEG